MLRHPSGGTWSGRPTRCGTWPGNSYRRRVEAVAIDAPRFLDYLEKDPEVGFTVMRRVARAISRRLASLRRTLLETIIDYERPARTIDPEN